MKQFKFLLFTPLFTLILFSAIAQTPSTPPDKNLIQNRNDFYNTYWTDPQQALIHAQAIASNKESKWFLRDMLHSEIYSVFHYKTENYYKEEAIKKGSYNSDTWKQEYDVFLEKPYQTLVLLESDSNLLLSNSARPILYWVNIIRGDLDNLELKKLVNDFTSTQLSQDDIFYNSAGLYALLIYEFVSNNQNIEPDAERLLTAVLNKLQCPQEVKNTNSASHFTLYKRAWYRYLYAYANHLKANKLLKIGKEKDAYKYQKVAFEFTPDIADQRFSYAYLFEKFILFEGEDDSLVKDYLNNSEKNPEVILDDLSKIALKKPIVYKDSLKTFYENTFPKDENFQSFWNRLVNSDMEVCPPFEFESMDGITTVPPHFKGKWLLVEFWGTWCGLCREKHPELQAFFEYTEFELSDKIQVLSFACNDTEEKVKSYMTKFNYTFPVSISDGSVEKKFNIKGYPTILLISPEGNYLNIPISSNYWIDFVKQYASLE